MLGNIRFIGELGKLEVVNEGILHKCIQQLLEKKRGLSLIDQAEDIECLCQIMKTVGKRLDTPRAKLWMDQYFERMASVRVAGDMPSRIRFMLQDAHDMRRNSWEPRRVAKEMTPQTIGQIRKEFPHTRVESGLFNRPAAPTKADLKADLFDIFGAPMASKPHSKAAAGKPNSYNDRSKSPNAQQQRAIYDRPEPELMMREIYRGDSDMPTNNRPDYTNNRPDISNTRPNFANNRPDNMNSRPDYHNGGAGKPAYGEGNIQDYRGNRSPRDMSPYQQRDQRDRNMQHRDLPRDNGGRNRDYQPRLTSKSLASMSSEKLSFRPGSALSQRPKFQPSSPHQLPKSARSTNNYTQDVRETPIFTKPATPVIINKDSKPKPKKQTIETVKTTTNGRSSPAGKQTEAAKTSQLLEKTAQLWGSEDSLSVCLEISQMFSSLEMTTIAPKVARKLIKQGLTTSGESSLQVLGQFLKQLATDKHMDTKSLELMFSDLLDELPLLESTYPSIRSQTSQLFSTAVCGELMSLPAVCEMLQGGTCHPLALEFLQNVKRNKKEEWLTSTMLAEKISCLSLLPSSAKSDDATLSLLEKYELTSLVPLLTLQKQLWSHIEQDPNPASFFKWIMKNISQELQGDDEFTRILFTCLLKYVVGETSMKEGTDTSVLPDKSVQEQEKILFCNYQEIMLRFLHESNKRQMIALYALQVFSYNNQFPKGMMLRMFTYLYDLEIVDEDAFMTWKEAINEDYPGKGKALFQVNQWLTWLEHAESESEDDDE